jgi:hypothetical protein
MTDELDSLRRALGARRLTTAAVEAAVGEERLAGLRREYFPRWRPDRVHTARPSLRAYRRVVVEDRFEARLVKAIAPADLVVRVDIARR